MNAGWWFLGVSVYGALYTLNAYRPFRFPLAIVPAFFASWLTHELPAHHIAWQAAGTIVFVRLGALEAWPGWVGLGITLASWAGLAGLIQRSHRAHEEMEDALLEGLGPAYRDHIDPALLEAHDPRIPRGRVAGAFYFRHRDVVRRKDISYGPHGRRNQLDVWHHQDPGERAPVLVWVHGGGWVVGHKAQQALPMLNRFAARGWVCVSLNYRLSPRATFPEHLIDVKRAVAWVKQHIAEYGGDPEFVVVSGGSAGGHLATLTALTPGNLEYQPGFEDTDTGVQACIALYPSVDFTNDFEGRGPLEWWGMRRFLEQRVLKLPLDTHREEYVKASPIHRVHEDAPPFMIIHGEHDLLAPVSDAREFAHRLRGACREPVVYCELRKTQHAFEVFHSVRTHHVLHGIERFADWVLTRHRAHQAQGNGTSRKARAG